MFRKLFCYSCFSLEALSISYVVYSMVIKVGFNQTLLDISLVFGTLNIFVLLIAFLCYGAPKNSYKDYMIRYISYNDILKENHLITIRIRGNGFLYNMVRIIAGTLIKIGMHELPSNCVTSILEAKSREAAGPTAPAQGLMLVGIEYPHLQ